jgi:hypothetical protein
VVIFHCNVFVWFFSSWVGGAVEKIDDTKGVIRSRKSKNRQHNGQKKKTKSLNKTLHRKLKIKQHEPQLKPG